MLKEFNLWERGMSGKEPPACSMLDCKWKLECPRPHDCQSGRATKKSDEIKWPEASSVQLKVKYSYLEDLATAISPIAFANVYSKM